jgi:hypothetical protein
MHPVSNNKESCICTCTCTCLVRIPHKPGGKSWRTVTATKHMIHIAGQTGADKHELKTQGNVLAAHINTTG